MTNYNLDSILIKIGYFIKILKPNTYKKPDIKLYQYLIQKLIYLVYNTSSNIIFATG